MPAIISNGSTDIELSHVMEKNIYNIEKSTRLSAGGKVKTQTAGRRFKMTVDARTSSSVWLQIMEMLTDQSPDYYYTPERDFPVYAGITFPIKVSFTLQDPTYENPDILYIRFDVEGVAYL